MTSEAPAAERRRSAGILGNSGAVLVEFALLFPVLLLILTGTLQFGLVISNYVMLTNAVGVGAMQFAFSRGDPVVGGPPASGPMSDTVNAIKAAAPSLTPANLSYTLRVANPVSCPTPTTCPTPLPQCTSDALCASALTAAAGYPAQVTVNYILATPCTNLQVMGYAIYNFFPSPCTLTLQVTERVQ
jgi:Flp pilus assembly protein TadG